MVIIGGLLAPVLPGYGLPVLIVALATAAPILVFGRMRARGSYPSAAIRLWVFRPFWYVQLGLPLIAAGGVLGCLAGAPFGVAASTGRWALLAAASAYALAAVAGYIGSGRPHRTRARPPTQPSPAPLGSWLLKLARLSALVFSAPVVNAGS